VLQRGFPVNHSAQLSGSPPASKPRPPEQAIGSDLADPGYRRARARARSDSRTEISVRHIRRTGILARLSPATLALLCPCDDCFNLRLNAGDERARRNAVSRDFNPSCEYCGAPTIWRDFAFVCPYAENPRMHDNVRALSLSRTPERDAGSPAILESIGRFERNRNRLVKERARGAIMSDSTEGAVKQAKRIRR
jgi:hypothetical protein